MLVSFVFIIAKSHFYTTLNSCRYRKFVQHNVTENLAEIMLSSKYILNTGDTNPETRIQYSCQNLDYTNNFLMLLHSKTVSTLMCRVLVTLQNAQRKILHLIQK